MTGYIHILYEFPIYGYKHIKVIGPMVYCLN